jgi:serine protease Do
MNRISDPSRRVRPRVLARAAGDGDVQGRLRRGALATAVAVALAAAGTTLLPFQTSDAADGGQPVNAPIAPAATQAGPPSFADVAERVTPAVVNVTVTQRAAQRLSLPRGEVPEDSPLFEFFKRFGGDLGSGNGLPMPREREGEGSGFLVDATGYIVTNNHVIEGAERIEITMNDGTQFLARVVGRDPKTDLALVKIDSDQPLPYVALGNSAKARIGDWVLAVGNPFGLGGSVNAGIISARGRDIQSGPYDDYIQIDAPINRGNSGGPLFDAAGNVIGVNTAIFSPSGGNIGIGFAIPAETVAEVVSDLRTKGRVERGWLGVQIQPVTEEIAASLGLDSAKGALVADVLGGTPAEQAGVRSGDVIVSAAGEPMEDYRDLTKLIARIDAGTGIELTVIRDGRSRTLPVTIGSMPHEDGVTRPAAPAADDDEPRIGLFLAPLTPELRSERGLDADSTGVLVAQVEAGSPAQRAGIEAGSLISMVGQQPVSTPDEVIDAVRKAAKSDRPSVLLRVEQEGEQRFIAVPFQS